MLAEVGYTPVRHWAGGLRWFEYFDKGRGSSDWLATTEDASFEIDCWVRFKIAALGDLGCLILTGSRAPSAMLRFRYRIDSDSAQIRFFGTRLPSQSYYVAWNRYGIHDMLTADTAAIDSFLEAGACKDAVCTPHEGWNGTANTVDIEKY